MLLDKTSLEQLYYEYAPRMTAFARRILQDPRQAEDLVQDVFIRFWERYKGKESDHWHPVIFTMTRNRCLDILRHLSVKRNIIDTNIGISPEEEFLFIEDLVGDGESTDEKLLLSDLNRELDRIIDSLPPRCKEVFSLSRKEGLHNQEIAQRLGITVKAVEKQMTRALKALRAKLSSGEFLNVNEKLLPILREATMPSTLIALSALNVA